jgi:phosphohistidine swiveling domain-containing protein
MSLSEIKSVEFWAREYLLPLFWLTDKRHLILNDNLLCFYNKSVLHLYFINGRYNEEIQKGHRFFSQAGAFAAYHKNADRIIFQIGQFIKKYGNTDIKKLSNRQLKVLFEEMVSLLNRYSNIYTWTEEVRLKKFESLASAKEKKTMHQLGRLRFKLRKAGEQVFYLLFKELLTTVGKSFNIAAQDLYFYTSKEINKVFTGKSVPQKLISRRKKGYLLWKMGGREIILTGQEYKKIWKWVNHYFTNSKQAITGTIAYKGKVRGSVRLVLHKSHNISNQIRKFRKNEILVTEMTRPDTILAYQRAKAIITDEGGITSHAAIISRELRIPCVIGTKIATQVLRDGDKVEVDATRGQVKLLQK